MIVRPYRPEDLSAVYDVCLRTGHHGADASGRYRFPRLLGDVFAAPYVTLEPHLAFVLDNGERAVGYVLGTADTARFVEDYRRDWLPVVRDRYPAPSAEPVTPDEAMIRALHHPEYMLKDELSGYPAHLHIDLLPEAQGAGHGRQLMQTLLDALRAAGAPRVHLGMAAANRNARAFYDRLGFHELAVPNAPGSTFMGRATG